MITKNLKYKCDWCGRFVAHDDFILDDSPDSPLALEPKDPPDIVCRDCWWPESCGVPYEAEL